MYMITDERMQRLGEITSLGIIYKQNTFTTQQIRIILRRTMKPTRSFELLPN